MRKFIIEPIAKNVNPSPLILSYQSEPGKQKYLHISDGSYTVKTIEWKRDEKGNGSANPVPDKIIFSLRGQGAKMHYEILFEDDEAKILNNIDRQANDNKKKAVYDFFYNDPRFSVNGKQVSNNPSFSPIYAITDITEKAEQKLISFKDRKNIEKKIFSMTLSQKRNVMFYFGEKPVSKEVAIVEGKEVFRDFTNDELEQHLVESPIIFGSDGGVKTFMQVFMPDKMIFNFELNIKKAILYGIIENKEGSYFLGSTLLGSTEDDVMAYIKKEDSLYTEHIIPKVEVMDGNKITESTKQSADQLTNLKKVKTSDAGAEFKEISILRAEVKQLATDRFLSKEIFATLKGLKLESDGGFKAHVASKDELLIAVAEGRRRKKEAEIEPAITE